MPECPTCDKQLENEVGVKSHHAQVHDESIADKSVFTCEVCGSDFEGYTCNSNRFCSSECKHVWDSERMSGDGSPTYKGAKKEVACDNCDEKFERYRSQLSDYDSNYCSYECKASAQVGTMEGEDNPAWKGGEVPFGRGKLWESISQEIVDCDGKCLSCGKTNTQHLSDTGRRLDVHHVKPLREYDEAENAHDIDNLVSLCRQCHNAIESGKKECPSVPDRNL